MTPFGHAAVSYLTGKSIKIAPIFALIAGGLLVDIDAILLPFPWFNSIHRVLTHNLFFLAMMSFCGSLLVKKSRIAVGLSLFAGGALHLVFDAMSDNNDTNGLGVALFWPVSDQMFMLFNLAEPDTTTTGWSDPDSMARLALKDLIWEVPFWIMALFLLVRSNGERFLSFIKSK